MMFVGRHRNLILLILVSVSYLIFPFWDSADSDVHAERLLSDSQVVYYDYISFILLKLGLYTLLENSYYSISQNQLYLRYFIYPQFQYRLDLWRILFFCFNLPFVIITYQCLKKVAYVFKFRIDLYSFSIISGFYLTFSSPNLDVTLFAIFALSLYLFYFNGIIPALFLSLFYFILLNDKGIIIVFVFLPLLYIFKKFT